MTPVTQSGSMASTSRVRAVTSAPAAQQSTSRTRIVATAQPRPTRVRIVQGSDGRVVVTNQNQ
jgi:hypothetical protein